MAGITKHVEIDLDDFSDQDIIDEVSWRGLDNHFYEENINKMADYQLIDEITNRGYTVYGMKSDVMQELFSSYISDTPDQFKKHLLKLFIENGFHP